MISQVAFIISVYTCICLFLLHTEHMSQFDNGATIQSPGVGLEYF